MFWLTIVVQVVGVATIGALHLLPHGRRRNFCQRVFFASLLAMGCMTLAAVCSASHAWMSSGASLSVMTMCATFDFGSRERPGVSY
jgi:hypothetical protein